MNRLNIKLREVAAMEAVRGFREDEKGARPGRSYRGARRNLARALRHNVPGLMWRAAVFAANQATAQSCRPAPKGVDASKAVRTVDTLGNVGMATRSDVEGAPEPVELVPGGDVADYMAPAEIEAMLDAHPIAVAEVESPGGGIGSEPAKPKRVRKPKVVVDETDPFPGEKDADPVKVKRVRKPKAEIKEIAPAKPARKAVAKASPKTAAKASAKAPAAPRKRVVKPKAA